MTLKTLIVDDEPFARDDLRHMLSAHENLEVVGEAGMISEAKKQLLENYLDVVFLDIQLRGGTGFDLVPFVDETVKIIFITAHDDYAIRAFEVNALDYILKPVTADRLAESVARLSTGSKKKKADLVKPGPLNTEDRVFVKTDTGRLFIDLKEIIAISTIGGNYTTLHLTNGQDHVCRKTFKEWETILPQSVFIRPHRSSIINIDFIEGIMDNKDGSCLVRLSQQSELFPVSRRMVKQVKDLFKERTV